MPTLYTSVSGPKGISKNFLIPKQLENIKASLPQLIVMIIFLILILIRVVPDLLVLIVAQTITFYGLVKSFTMPIITTLHPGNACTWWSCSNDSIALVIICQKKS